MAGGCCVEDDAFVAERLDLLEDFGEGHGFIDTRDLYVEWLVLCLSAQEECSDATTHAEGKILHHVAHAAETRHGVLSLLTTSIQHVGDRAVGVNLHGAEVVEAINKTGVLSELLVEGIGQVVGRIGRDEENVLAVLCELDGQRAGSCCLSDTTLTTDKDPAE